ncbi:hypothetical protein KKH82_01240 [Patescibacteria group bacterium]|nr:hypothetical protein [Patescibacteria group bacterium]
MTFDKQFKDYHESIKLTTTKKNSLRSNKDALRNKIKKAFTDNSRTPTPKFFIQGSFSMFTTINPLTKQYDIDDGLYLQHLDTSKPVSEWPSPVTVHRWVVDAIDGHTGTPPVDKSQCVRAIYANEEKHVDLPIYAEKDGTYYLAVKNVGWIESDPKVIKEWFNKASTAKGEQLRRIVRCLKGWKDFREDENSSVTLYGGFQLTVLAEKHFQSDNSDEVAFFKMVESIYNNLSTYRYSLSHPVKLGTDITVHYSDTRKSKFQEEFTSLYNKSKAAHDEIDCVEKSKKWQKVFGSRFPTTSYKDCMDEEAERSLATITSTASRPWLGK